MTKHTETNWKPDAITLENLKWRLPEEDRIVLLHQVQCVKNMLNLHDALVEALEFIISGERTDGTKYDKHDVAGFIIIAKQALKKAESEG